MNERSNVLLHTGNKMPVLGLGTWQLDGADDAVENALELGYRMIDTSGDYGTQPALGKGIKRSGIKRDEFYLVTKVEEDEDAFESAKKSLEELQLAYADLILIHRPPKEGVGEELWRGLIKAKDQGLAKDIGVSNYSIDEIEALHKATGTMPAVNQIEWSPFGYQLDMLNYCMDHHIILQAYSPLTRGEKLEDDHLKAVAESYGKTPAQVLIRWNLQLGIVPIIKAGDYEHQAENMNVFDFELKPEDMEMLKSLNEEYSSLGELQYI